MLSALLAINAFAQPIPPRPPDEVIAAYAKAIGGLPAIDAFTSRKIKGSTSILGKAEFYWQKPDNVLLLSGRERTGFDGAHGWVYTRRKKVRRLAQGEQIPLEDDANPLRYVHLRRLYSDLSAAPQATVDDTLMDVVVAPNDLAQTTFYFDAQTHLLARIDEKGNTSAYFIQTAWFRDYRTIDGVLFPFHITHKSTGPAGTIEDLHIKSIQHNVPIDPESFSKPQSTKLVFGGKR